MASLTPDQRTALEGMVAFWRRMAEQAGDNVWEAGLRCGLDGCANTLQGFLDSPDRPDAASAAVHGERFSLLEIE